MSVKEFLERARHLDDGINSPIAELTHLRELSMKISSSRLEEHIDHSAPQEAPFVKLVERIVDKEREINAAIDKLVAPSNWQSATTSARWKVSSGNVSSATAMSSASNGLMLPRR